MKTYRYVSTERNQFAFLRPIVSIEKEINGRVLVKYIGSEITFLAEKSRLFHIPSDLELLERYLNRHFVHPRALCRDLFSETYTLSWKGLDFSGSRLEIISQVRKILKAQREGQGRLNF